MAFTLMQQLKGMALAGTEWRNPRMPRSGVRLLKIGAAIVRNTRRISILLASHQPLRNIYFIAATVLTSP
jgi:Transposase DDE domain group 1